MYKKIREGWKVWGDIWDWYFGKFAKILIVMGAFKYITNFGWYYITGIVIFFIVGSVILVWFDVTYIMPYSLKYNAKKNPILMRILKILEETHETNKHREKGKGFKIRYDKEI